MLALSHAKHRQTVDRWNDCSTEKGSIRRLLQTYKLRMQHLDGRHAESRQRQVLAKNALAQTKACRENENSDFEEVSLRQRTWQ